MVEIVQDTSRGRFSVQLAALSINGNAYRMASSNAVLSGLSKLNGFGRSSSSTSGAHVFLPQNTEVRFTLMTSPQQTQATPPTARSPLVTLPAIPPVAKWADAPQLLTSDVASACSAPDREHQAFCYGVLMMFYDQSLANADSESYKSSFCIPANVTGAQLRDAFLDDTKKRSDQLSSPVSLFFLQTWENAFPCPKAPARKRVPVKKKPS